MNELVRQLREDIEYAEISGSDSAMQRLEDLLDLLERQ